jgi:hypothetical protein
VAPCAQGRSAADRGGSPQRGAAGSLSPLREPGALSGFPAFQLRPSRRLARIHRRAQNPWWFKADGSGRFDLEPERGTCYLAEEPLGAFVEAFCDSRVVHASTVGDRALATLRAPTRLRLADCTVEEARRFRITLEIGASDDYELCRRWAEALAGEGYAGIRYRLRHDPSGALLGIALFGAAGEADWAVEASSSIPDDVIREAEERFGIIVVPGVIR